MTNASPQHNHGAISRPINSENAYLQTAEAAAGSGTLFNLAATGDVNASSTQLAVGFWVRFVGADGDSPRVEVPICLSRLATNSATAGPFGITFGDNNGSDTDKLRVYFRQSDGTSANDQKIGFFGSRPTDEEIFILVVMDSNGIGEFASIVTTSHTIAMLTYSEGGALTNIRSVDHAGFTAGAKLGTDRTGQTDSFKWRIGSDNAANMPTDMRDVFVFNDLTNLSVAVVEDIANGVKSPMSVDGCIRWWPLDGAGESVVAESSTVADWDLELEDIAGDVAGSGSLPFTVTGTAPTYTTDKIGPDVTSATDDWIDYNTPALLSHGLASLGQTLATKNFTLVQPGDSYQNQARQYSWTAAITGAGSAAFPVTGVFHGFGRAAAGTNTMTCSAVAAPTVGTLVEIAIPGGGYDNTYLGTTPHALPNMVGTLELNNTDVGAYVPAADTFGTLTVRNDLFRSSLSETQYDWLDENDLVALRVLGHNYSGIDTNLQTEGESELRAHSSTSPALPRWSAGENPFTDSANALGSEDFFWWFTTHTAKAAGVSSATFTLKSPTGIAAGKSAHFAGFSAHKMDASGNPIPGVNLVNLSMSGTTDAEILADAVPSSSTSKKVLYSQVQEIMDGANWGTSTRAVVVYDVDDPGVFDAAAYIALMGPVLAASGYSRVHYVFMSNWVASQSGETDIFTLRNDRIAREAALLAVAAARSDCTVVSLLSLYGGAMPGGYSPDSNAFEPIGGGNNCGARPLRELRTATDAVTTLNIGITAAATMLDTTNVHMGDGTNQPPNAEDVGAYWLGQLLALSSNRSRDDRTRER